MNVTKDLTKALLWCNDIIFNFSDYSVFLDFLIMPNTIHYIHYQILRYTIFIKNTKLSWQLSRLCLTFLVWWFGDLSLFWFKLLFVRKLLSMKTCVMQKLTNWFSLQCNCLVSIWRGTLLRGISEFCGFLNAGSYNIITPCLT